MSHRHRTQSIPGLRHALVVMLLTHPSRASSAPDLGGNPNHAGWDEFARTSAANETPSGPEVGGDVGPALERSGVRAGSMLRVRLTSGRTLEGPFERYEESRLVLADSPRTDVATADLDSLWHETISKNKAATKGGIVEGIIGAAAGGVLLTVTHSYTPVDGGDSDSGTGDIALGVLSGCFLGSLLGAFLGNITSAGSPEWTLLYPRERTSPTNWSVPAQPAP